MVYEDPIKSALKTVSFALLIAIGTTPLCAQDSEPRGQEEQDRRDVQNQRRQQQRSDEAFAQAQAAREASVARNFEEFLKTAEETPQLRLRFFLEETRKFALQIEERYKASLLGDWSHNDLARRLKVIEETNDRLRDFVNFGTDPPQINVTPLPLESLTQRIERMVILSRRLIPNILFLAGGDSINLSLLNQVRDDLAITEALSRALPESEF